jgi:eukaryotic-like serine/threonine-protein kinase
VRAVRMMHDDLEEESQPASHKYRCVLRLDSGGMAEVFLAVSRGVAGFNKLFVLKRLRASLADNTEHREMFLNEARLTARLNHPNVVQTYEVGEDNDGIFIAMEYLEGQPLSRVRRELSKHKKALADGLNVRIASEVLAGLHYAHELTDYDGTPLKIVHRDVSPQNVFITYDGQVKLVDFGIAKTHDSGTQAGVFKGKFAYTSPEQIRGESVDRRADIFTAGILLWEMLTGERLLDASNPAQTFARLLNHPMPPVRTMAPSVDAKLEAIVMRALERNPANRFQTAQQMREVLEEWLLQCGQAVRNDELAQVLGDLFRTERARVQATIKEELAGLSHASSSRVIAAKRLPLGDESVSMHASTPAVTHSAVTPSGEIVRDAFDRNKLRRVGFVAGGIAIAVLVYAAARPRTIIQAAPVPSAAAPSLTVPEAQPPPPAPPPTAAPSPAVVEVEETHVNKPKWSPHPTPKKATAAAPTPSTAPAPMPPPPQPEPSSKEKRKFRVEL